MNEGHLFIDAIQGVKYFLADFEMEKLLSFLRLKKSKHSFKYVLTPVFIQKKIRLNVLCGIRFLAREKQIDFSNLKKFIFYHFFLEISNSILIFSVNSSMFSGLGLYIF